MYIKIFNLPISKNFILVRTSGEEAHLRPKNSEFEFVDLSVLVEASPGYFVYLLQRVHDDLHLQSLEADQPAYITYSH